MSLPTTATGLQVNLQTLGFYKGKIDGAFGNVSKAALLEYVKSLTPVKIVADVTDKVDERSERNIATLRVEVQSVTRALVRLASSNGIEIRITSGTRTYAEQDALFAKGGVTKAKGGYSNHNFGIALDFTIFKNGKPVYESPDYKIVGQLGKSLGFTWGGDWKSFVDEPHLEMRPAWAKNMSEREMLAELRNQQLRIA